MEGEEGRFREEGQRGGEKELGIVALSSLEVCCLSEVFGPT